MLTWIFTIWWHPRGFSCDSQNYPIYPKIHVRRFVGIGISPENHILPSDRSHDPPKDHEIRKSKKFRIQRCIWELHTMSLRKSWKSTWISRDIHVEIWKSDSSLYCVCNLCQYDRVVFENGPIQVRALRARAWRLLLKSGKDADFQGVSATLIDSSDLSPLPPGRLQ